MSGDLRLEHAKCGTVELDGEDQYSVRQFAANAQRLFQRSGIESVTLRMAPPQSKYGGTLMGAIVRTALQLIDDVEIIVVPTVSVRAWVERESHQTPSWPHQARFVGEAQQRAVEAAAFAALAGSRSLAGDA
jgi:hypothetical protein